MEIPNKTGEATTKMVDFNTKLVCINYPGTVNDVDKMVETLGGINEIESSAGNRRKMLNLKFRPDDQYCKPTVSDLDRKPGILIKLIPKESSSNKKGQQFDCNVVGVTALTYSFNRLCDFQYLPLIAAGKENSDSSLNYIYDKIVPKNIPNEDWLSDSETNDVPYFLPPAVFSRSDNPLNHLYFNRSKFYEGRFKPEYAEMLRQQELDRKNSKSIDEKVISHKKGGFGGLFCSIRDTNVPSAPSKLALHFMKMKYTSKEACEKIKGLFEERPIWSRTAIQYYSHVTTEHLKFILPAVAFYFRNGPWRAMWCRYGYDPRKDPSSRIYQTFDFRVRATVGLKAKVSTKKEFVLQHRAASPISTQKIPLSEDLPGTSEKSLIDASCFMLKPGMIPPGRQMLYQYCDIHLPEIQAMLDRLPPVIPETLCDIKNGWLPNKFPEQCREIANKYMVEHVQQLNLEKSKSQVEKEDQSDACSSVSKISDDSKNQDFLEIYDSESDTNTDESSDLADNDETTKESTKMDSKRPIPREHLDDEDDEIDMDAVEDVNKHLEEDYAAMKDFDRLVYDSD